MQLHVHCVCTACALCTACAALRVHCVCTACALRVHCVRTACALRARCVCTACALRVHCVCTACALRARCVCTMHCVCCTACALRGHCMCTACAAEVLCVCGWGALHVHRCMRAACTLQVQLRRRASSTGLTGDALRSHEASRKTVAGVKFVKVGVTSSSHHTPVPILHALTPHRAPSPLTTRPQPLTTRPHPLTPHHAPSGLGRLWAGPRRRGDLLLWLRRQGHV